MAASGSARLASALPSGEGAIRDGVHASYLHTHPAGAPGSVRRFVELAAGAGGLSRG